MSGTESAAASVEWHRVLKDCRKFVPSWRQRFFEAEVPPTPSFPLIGALCSENEFHGGEGRWWNSAFGLPASWHAVTLDKLKAVAKQRCVGIDRLTPGNWFDHFSALLRIEEHQMLREMAQNDLHLVKPKRVTTGPAVAIAEACFQRDWDAMLPRLLALLQEGEHSAVHMLPTFKIWLQRSVGVYELHVPGVSDGRPPLVVGDRVYMRDVHLNSATGQETPEAHFAGTVLLIDTRTDVVSVLLPRCTVLDTIRCLEPTQFYSASDLAAFEQAGCAAAAQFTRLQLLQAGCSAAAWAKNVPNRPSSVANTSPTETTGSPPVAQAQAQAQAQTQVKPQEDDAVGKKAKPRRSRRANLKKSIAMRKGTYFGPGHPANAPVTAEGTATPASTATAAATAAPISPPSGKSSSDGAAPVIPVQVAVRLLHPALLNYISVTPPAASWGGVGREPTIAEAHSKRAGSWAQHVRSMAQTGRLEGDVVLDLLRDSFREYQGLNQTHADASVQQLMAFLLLYQRAHVPWLPADSPHAMATAISFPRGCWRPSLTIPPRVLSRTEAHAAAFAQAKRAETAETEARTAEGGAPTDWSWEAHADIVGAVPDLLTHGSTQFHVRFPLHRVEIEDLVAALAAVWWQLMPYSESYGGAPIDDLDQPAIPKNIHAGVKGWYGSAGASPELQSRGRAKQRLLSRYFMAKLFPRPVDVEFSVALRHAPATSAWVDVQRAFIDDVLAGHYDDVPLEDEEEEEEGGGNEGGNGGTDVRRGGEEQAAAAEAASPERVSGGYSRPMAQRFAVGDQSVLAPQLPGTDYVSGTADGVMGDAPTPEQVRRSHRERHEVEHAPRDEDGERLNSESLKHYSEWWECSPSRRGRSDPTYLQFFNPVVQRNPSQMAAVTGIVAGVHGRIPYIVFGPPGTGKTMTLVESILQLLALYPAAKILLTAPSDPAVDVAAERIAAAFDKPSVRQRIMGAVRPSPSPTAEAAPGGDSMSAYPDGTPYQSMLLCLSSRRRLVDSIQFPRVRNRHSLIDERRRVFQRPTLEQILAARVIACSCTAATEVLQQGAGHLVFSHIVMDEASQATEPQTVMALQHGSDSTRVVLCGDPRQLGATLRSRLAAEHGLGVSLQERLLTAFRWVYVYRDPWLHIQARGGRVGAGLQPAGLGLPGGSVDEPTPSYVEAYLFMCQLSYNFRSHADILLLSSAMFYRNSLQAAAPSHRTRGLLQTAEAGEGGGEGRGPGGDRTLRSLLQGVADARAGDGWSRAQGPDAAPAPEDYAGTADVDEFRVAFVSVQGQDEHGMGSPSWYNPQEAAAVVDIIVRLLGSSSGDGSQRPISQGDIAVITPYRQQVLLLRKKLRASGLYQVSVGQTEHFQGTEKRIVLISTVLSTNYGVQAARLANAGITDAEMRRIAGVPSLLRHHLTSSDFIKQSMQGGTGNGEGGLESDDLLLLGANSTGVVFGPFGDPKAFNVAVTRAEAQVIVVGDADVLCLDRYWSVLLVYTVDNGAYVGKPCQVVEGILRDAAQEEDEAGGGEGGLTARMEQHLSFAGQLGEEEGGDEDLYVGDGMSAQLEAMQLAAYDDLQWRVQL